MKGRKRERALATGAKREAQPKEEGRKEVTRGEIKVSQLPNKKLKAKCD